MRSASSRQQSRFGTLTVSARLGWYEVLSYANGAENGAEQMFVVLPVKPAGSKKLAKELRAIAKHLDGREDSEP